MASSSGKTLSTPDRSSVAGSSRGGTAFGARPKRKQISFDDYHALWRGLATSQPVRGKGNPCEMVPICCVVECLKA